MAQNNKQSRVLEAQKISLDILPVEGCVVTGGWHLIVENV